MKIKVRKGLLEGSRADALAIFVFENGLKVLSGAAARIDKAAGGIIKELLESGDFRGKPNEAVILYTRGNFPSRRLLLAGLGKKEDAGVEVFRRAMACAVRKATGLKLKSLAVSLEIETGDAIESLAAAAVEGAALSCYRFDCFQKEESGRNCIEALEICEPDSVKLKKIEAAANCAEAACSAVLFARDLACGPSNQVTPRLLSRQAAACSGKKLRVKTFGPAEMKKLGMNAVLGVAQGSSEPAAFIEMHYKGNKPSAGTVVLVGKAITFDSGGISLKPADKMEEMKADMSGGAAVIAVLKAAAEMKLPVNVVGLIPAAENLPGGKAYKPGDILKSYSGLSIEVISTDAEGRLLLADALGYAAKFKPAAVIDIATLTGACQVALGDRVSGMFGTDEKIKSLLRQAAEETGEPVWELPLVDDYKELIKSDVADLKNTGGRAGGAITAALFLKRFVDPLPWAHLDIAGPAWSAAEKGYLPKGATGFGVRLLLSFLRRWPENQADRQR
ncbi:MAG: leucyl aminopeptidase [Syntrophaceae bacterium]